MSDNKEYPVLYVVINNDLNMGKGKIASQVGHVIESIIEELVRTEILSSNLKKTIVNDYNIWKYNGRTKIILKGTTEELMELCKIDGAKYVLDAGKTQIESGSLTAVGFPPSKTKKELLKKFKLL